MQEIKRQIAIESRLNQLKLLGRAEEYNELFPFNMRRASSTALLEGGYKSMQNKSSITESPLTPTCDILPWFISGYFRGENYAVRGNKILHNNGLVCIVSFNRYIYNIKDSGEQDMFLMHRNEKRTDILPPNCGVHAVGMLRL